MADGEGTSSGGDADDLEQVASRARFDDTMPAAPPAMEAAAGPAIVVGPARPATGPPARPSMQATDRYRLGVELGRGGMGRVVEAFDVQLGRTVALKEALATRGGQGTFRRFAREVHITARLEHASIIPLYDSGTTIDGRPFYVMRRVTGRPFDEVITRSRNLGERLTQLPALLRAIDAMAHAHKRGVIHRDLKPGNILVGELGETVVIDWGLAKVIGEQEDSVDPIEPRPSDSLRTQVGSVFGTPGFMAPEQARGEDPGTRSDVYALGACLYQLLAGTPPFGGSTSATEVIDRTRKNQIRPLAEAAPGAPKELVAICTKALAFEQADRYANAGQLGEDVRRFLDGQLVAAHRYTRRQRVARFAKRNRLALTISAIAMVVIAILSWTNVHRILVEREMARDAEVRTREHADDLVIQNATTYVQTDPTRALAVLRELDPTSDKLVEARAIAEAAVTRGVAWGIDANDDELMPSDISPDGKRLAIATMSGTLQIYDLDSHALLRTKAVSHGARGVWVDNGRRLLVWGGEGVPFVLDPATNQTIALSTTKVGLVTVTPAGDHALCEVDNHAVARLDVATLTLTTVYSGPGRITLAADGTMFAVDADHVATVYDLDGKSLASRPVDDSVTHLVTGPDHRVALATTATVWEIDLASGTWTERHVEVPPHGFVLGVLYRGPELTASTSDGVTSGFVREHWIERTRTASITTLPAVAGDNVLVMPALDHLVWATDSSTGTIPLPNVTPTRLTARAGVPRIVVSGRGLVLVFDLTHSVPTRLPVDAVGGQFTMLDDDTVLLWHNADPWRLFHLSTKERVDMPLRWGGFVNRLDVRTDEKRALLEFSEMRSHLLEVRDDPKPVRHLASGSSMLEHPETGTMAAHLIPGDATMFADGDNRLYVTYADAKPDELAQLDGAVRSITDLGRLKFAAISDNGEIVRGTLDDAGTPGTLERTHVPARDDLMVSNDLAGHLLIAAGKELLQWDTDVQTVAKFDRSITAMMPIAGGVAVLLEGRSVSTFDLATRKTRVLTTRNTHQIEITPDGKLLVALLDGGKLIVADLPGGEPWELPASYLPMNVISVTPTTRSIVVGSFELDMWHLPTAGPDLMAWIEAQTNARIRGRRLVWPWQDSTPVP